MQGKVNIKVKGVPEKHARLLYKSAFNRNVSRNAVLKRIIENYLRKEFPDEDLE